MKPRQLLQVALALYLLAWALPVSKGGVALPDGLPGWEAFRAAASPVWPYQGLDLGAGLGAALSVASAGTNLLMLAAVLPVSHGSRRWLRVAALACLAGFAVNASWLQEPADLRAGYYLWWLSFLGVAYALVKLSRSDSPQARSVAVA